MRNYAMLAMMLGVLGCSTPREAPTVKTTVPPVINPIEADAAYQRQDWATAEKQYLAIVQATPMDANAWFKLGNLYTHTNRYTEAQKAYREALNHNPQFAKAAHNLGALYLIEAQKAFERVMETTAKTDPLYNQTQTLLNQVTSLNNPPPPVVIEVPAKKMSPRKKTIRWN